jgi:hypothetical protein
MSGRERVRDGQWKIANPVHPLLLTLGLSRDIPLSQLRLYTDHKATKGSPLLIGQSQPVLGAKCPGPITPRPPPSRPVSPPH